ncbi:MAG: DUF2158 domain-containing protein [Ignavibacteriae bacterium]|nr:MAG: DUF2158 domain-containing protein [Ignavibacteriota bacterium]
MFDYVLTVIFYIFAKNRTTKNRTTKNSIIMTEKKLKVGDVVELKSGSPRMTISSIDDSDMAEVSFYTTKGGLETKYFPLDALKLCEDKNYPQTITFGV